ncbi:MAG: S-layer homology domain-containing protein [Egibacteraceae bacterium]
MDRIHPARAAGVLFLLGGFCAALIIGFAGSASASQWADQEQRLVDRINAERRAVGLGALRVDAELQRVARDWTGVMLAEHRLYHNLNLGPQVDRDWQRLGENVGWTERGNTALELVDAVHVAFMQSPAHRDNVLRAEFGWVGVGVQVTSAGRLWATVNFMQGAGVPPPPLLEPGTFRDVNGGTHAGAIRAIALAGVTQGCAPELFCPERQVTRGQMASFLTRALDLPPASGGRFADTAGSPHRAAIDSLAAAGITGGCATGSFCPNQPVSRGQMASFLQRAWDLPDSSVLRFVDITLSSVHRTAIEAIADAGITLGCADQRYCPNQPVKRSEMASFLGRALNLV